MKSIPSAPGYYADSKGNIGRHLNDVSDDNRLINLKWGTKAENAVDKVRNRDGSTTPMRNFQRACEKAHALGLAWGEIATIARWPKRKLVAALKERQPVE